MTSGSPGAKVIPSYCRRRVCTSHQLPTGTSSLPTSLRRRDVIQSAPKPVKGDRELYWDQTLPGFGLQVTVSGHCSYVVQYRAKGRSHRMRIGDPKTLKLGEARKQARIKLGMAAKGGHPLAEARNERMADKSTFKSVFDRYLEDPEHKKLRSIDHRKSMINRLVIPNCGQTD